MLLTIYNLPMNTRYADIKSLIHTKCGFKEIILDNLTQDGINTKKVTVGLAEEEDAAILVRKINGMFLDGQQLYVETIKKKQPSSLILEPNIGLRPTLQQPYYQQNKYQPTYQQSFSGVQQNESQSIGHTPQPFGLMYGVAQNTNFGYPQQLYQSTQQQQLMPQSVVGFDQRAPLGFNNQGKPSVWSDQNDWNPNSNASGGNQVSQQSRSSTRWNNPDDSSSHQRRDDIPRGNEQDRGSRSFRREAPSRDDGRSEPRRDFGRDAPSRDRGRDAPREQRRDASYRDRERDAPSRNRERDAPSRDRGREERNVPSRNAQHQYDREPSFRRSESSRAPQKRQLSPPHRQYQSEHVTNSSQQMRKFSQQRDGPKPNQSWNKPQPNKSQAGTAAEYFPPTKRPKKRTSDNQQVYKPNQDKTLAAKNALTQKRMHARSTTWRHQVVSAVAKEIMANPENKNNISQLKFIPELKRAIRDRLETLFGNDLEVRMPDMLTIYRNNFPVDKDTELFNEVTDYVKKNVNLAEDDDQGVPEADEPAPVAVEVITKTDNAQSKENEDFKQIIPSYPQGDKKMNKVLKKNNALIFQEEDRILSQLEPSILTALNEEIDDIGTLITEEFKDEPEPGYKLFHERVTATVINDYKKMMKVNFAKRMLNVGPIMVRVFTVPKMISRGKLAPALVKYGISSLRKSKKSVVYIGTCDTYDIHDTLCATNDIVVEGSSVVIKPFQLTGKNDQMSKEQFDLNRKRIMQSFKNTAAVPIHENVEDKRIDENIINLNVDYDTNENQDGNENQNDNENENDNENQNDNQNQGIEKQDVENEDPEIMVLDSKKEDSEIKEIPDEVVTNKSPECNEPQESIITQDDYAENADKAVVLETECSTEGIEENDSKDLENSIEPSKIYNTNIDNIEITDDKSKNSEEMVIATPFADDVDFTSDIDITRATGNNEAFKIDADPDFDIDKDLSEVNPDDLEDFRRNNIDDIDINDLNEDDLEDW